MALLAIKPVSAPSLGRLVWSPVAWCVVATVYCVVAALGFDVSSLVDRLGDSDDATRLITVRDLIAGAPWFDTKVPRIGAPEPLLSHWSRLIDLPLASGIVLLRPLSGPDIAELATRIAWPSLLLFVALLIVARDAHHREGLWACAFAILLVVTCDSALVQFRPGRIDHHNAQILCAVAGVLFLARSLQEKGLGVPAGLFFGLGLAVGLEALPLVIPALAFAAVLALWRPNYGAGVQAAAITATATLSVAFVLTVPPGRWLDIRCDTLALNLSILAAFCSAGLWAALRGGDTSSFTLRCAIASGPVLIGLASYAWLEPACLAGPMGQVDPAINAIWLNEVMETRSVFWLVFNYPAAGLAFLAFVTAGAAAQLALFRDRKDTMTGFSTGIVMLAVALGCWQVRLMPYASWLVVSPLAIWCAHLRGKASFSPAAAVGAVLVLSQTFLGLVMGTAVAAARHVVTTSNDAQPVDTTPCYLSSTLKPLARLVPGLVAADVDLGPFVVATTKHRVVAAPYHRLDKGIIANHTILAGSVGKARRQIWSLGVDYVALCAVPGQTTAPDTLRGLLLNGREVPFLREIDLDPARTIRVWRVVRST
jgi:hypothetical protein